MAPTRVLPADDNGEAPAELCHELREKFEIVGTVSNGVDAIDVTLRLDPDIIVLDIFLIPITAEVARADLFT